MVQLNVYVASQINTQPNNLTPYITYKHKMSGAKEGKNEETENQSISIEVTEPEKPGSAGSANPKETDALAEKTEKLAISPKNDDTGAKKDTADSPIASEEVKKGKPV